MSQLEKIFSVSELVESLNIHLGLLGELVVEGEITRIQMRNNQMAFLTIKDKTSTLDVFALLYQVPNLRVLTEGSTVRVYGSAGLYKTSGRFRVQARHIVPAGQGELQLAYEKLKHQLTVEGIFDLSHKRALPLFPETIGLITAPESQAYQDFIKVASARMPGLHIKFFPVTVQGVRAVSSVLNGLSLANGHGCDVLVLTRGGGSLEDLIAFNDERVTRAVASSKTPIVCAIGHEGNVSLAELAADLRASTPSNAAELVVQSRQHVVQMIDHAIKSIHGQIAIHVATKEAQIDSQLIRFYQHITTRVKTFEKATDSLKHIFNGYTQKISSDSQTQQQLTKRLELAANFWMKNSFTQVVQLERLLESVSYKSVLSRGFSITRNKQGRVINSIAQVERKDRVTITLSDGTISSSVEDIAPE